MLAPDPLLAYVPAVAAAEAALDQAKVGRQWKDGTRRRASLSLTQLSLLKQMLGAFVSEPGLEAWRIGWSSSDTHPFSRGTVDAVVTTQEPKALGRIDDCEYKLTQDLEAARTFLFKNEGPLFREQFFSLDSVKGEVVIDRAGLVTRLEACVGPEGLVAFREALLDQRLQEPATPTASRPRM